ncbi:glycerol-3-phosphate 1-O-acyltransferase PlsY [Fulvivirgaceae bacterium BMA12]|uniref:Glycerol-3-phosphate acyltransferase n=1 Tax=Agaribacillus aureus TaxID=3051825 RepID=A0ABT8LIF9_9BACT|nr:glycerol-3-phosphate 1-O-acyltransferase PlsY [Fulvivirgaceae bacterium BMA12]
MNFPLVAVSVVLAYLIGSIPTAVWVGTSRYGIDVREHGSGNAGATNTFRVLGAKAGIVVMLVDIMKGLAASSLAVLLFLINAIPQHDIVVFKLILGIIAILGHIFPVYVNFKGGKGVATLLGMALAIKFPVALICVGVFFIVLLISRYVSLSSIIGTLAFPILMTVPVFSPGEPVLVVFGFALFGIVTYTHKKNIKRILNGEENKTYLRFKKKSEQI